MHIEDVELVAHLRQAGEDLRDRFMLDRGAAGPARRIAAENGFGDKGGGGEAGGEDALVGTPPATLSAGGRRWALRACCRPAPACSVPSGDRDPALASSVPRRRRRAATGGPGGLDRPPWSMGVRKGEPTSPSGRSRRRNAGRGPGRESPGRGLQGGATAPCSMGPGRAEVSLVAMQRRLRCVSRDGLDARQRKRPAEQSLGETLLKRADEP